MILDIAGTLTQIVLAPFALVGLPLCIFAMGKMILDPASTKSSNEDHRSASPDQRHLALVKTDSVDNTPNAA